ncbi:MAG: hypothetical protein LBK58_13510 [Prevotellaceae bacterium]|jgi:hypothetical protein|nr:hypothetical protein [Prevotellaceae bacterium]
MAKVFKMFFIFAFSSAFLSSCLKDQESRVYVEIFSVIRSSAGATYFSSDDGIDLYPLNVSYNPDWGSDGDRIVVGFYYNPFTVSETTKRMDINVESLMSVQTDRLALPSTVDTVGTGKFLYDNNSSEAGIVAWTAQNYLTAKFSVEYSDAKKHTFGFIEEPELFRDDTLFLGMWHNTKENSKTKSAKSHIALNLSNYDQYLSRRDSTIISIKYSGEDLSSSAGNYICNVKYRRKDNSN